eukprot:GHUV01014676.1.p1 GENE.GHUV01014676.1~~GHUV01014676.1.p1  ORF type:complete len:342 (+),score=88.81 GHUV01014676.1:305-1330(+)
MDAQTRLLRDIGLSYQTLQQLTAQNIVTCRDVLLMSSIDLMELLNMTYLQAEGLLDHVASHTAPSYVTALDLHSTLHDHSVRIYTGLPGLDTALRIGLPPGAITELVGPAGVGKSQFCYTLALQVALPRALGGLESTLMYIDTETKFSSQRLLEMASERLAAATDSGLIDAQQLTYEGLVEPVLNRVLVMRPTTVEHLQAQLQGLKLEVARRDMKLIILDSIAALLRTDHAGVESAAITARGELLGQQAAVLKSIAEAHRIPVVVTNQVTARPSGPTTHAFQQQQQQRPRPGDSSSSSGHVTAALGTKWAHAVNVRLILERFGDKRVVKVGCYLRWYECVT